MNFDYTREPGKKAEKQNNAHKGTPLISIITPFYNGGEYFEQTFNCVVNQTFPWFEWIIIDDGSTDRDSLEKLDYFAKLDDRISVYHQKNKGLSGARNAGVEKSNTEIIVPLDADDLIEPVYLEYMWWALKCNPEAGWAYSDNCGFGAQEYLWTVPFSSERMKRENILVATAAIRKNVLNEVQGYYSRQSYFNEDWHFWLKLLARGYYPVHTGGILFWYRRKDDGMLHTVKHDKELFRQNERIIQSVAKKVKTEVAAIEFPRSKGTGNYIPPKSSDWDRCLYDKHDKTHVLMLIPWMEMGGADLFNLNLCKLIDKSKFEIGIITTQPGSNSWQSRFSEHVTDIFNLPDFLDIENWAEFISYYIKSRDVDVVFLSNSYYGYYLVPWLRKEFPDLAIVDYVHMEEWYWRNGGYARTSGVIGRALEKTYVCNERTRRVLINEWDRDPDSVETVYIGVDQDYFDPEKTESGLAKKELGISDERPMILFPCRIHPQKRPFLMLGIAEELQKRLPEVAFVVVGDGPQLDELKMAVSKAKLEETVYFAGRQGDMRPWYKDSAITLICSLKEGLALTAYESLSMGVPVVTSDVGGQAELIDENVGAVLPLMQTEGTELDEREFSKAEIMQYVVAIQKMLGRDSADAYNDLCRNCRKRIKEGFTLEIMISKVEQELLRLKADNEKRNIISTELKKCSWLADEMVTLFSEVESYENAYKSGFTDTKSELMRIANSRVGRRLIKIAFKMRLNKLFR